MLDTVEKLSCAAPCTSVWICRAPICASGALLGASPARYSAPCMGGPHACHSPALLCASGACRVDESMLRTSSRQRGTHQAWLHALQATRAWPTGLHGAASTGDVPPFGRLLCRQATHLLHVAGAMVQPRCHPHMPNMPWCRERIMHACASSMRCMCGSWCTCANSRCQMECSWCPWSNVLHIMIATPSQALGGTAASHCCVCMVVGIVNVGMWLWLLLWRLEVQQCTRACGCCPACAYRAARRGFSYTSAAWMLQQCAGTLVPGGSAARHARVVRLWYSSVDVSGRVTFRRMHVVLHVHA